MSEIFVKDYGPVCRENYDTELVVAKLSDCYSYKEFAEEAVREEVGDSNAK